MSLVGFKSQVCFASTIGGNSERMVGMGFQGGEQQSQIPWAAEFNRFLRNGQNYSSCYRFSSSKKRLFFVLKMRKFPLWTAAISKTKKIRSNKSECLNTFRIARFLSFCGAAIRCCVFPFTYWRMVISKKKHDICFDLCWKSHLLSQLIERCNVVVTNSKTTNVSKQPDKYQ